MSLAHSQGLRDALHKLRDTYYPPTAEEVQLFTSTLSTDTPLATLADSARLRPEMPIPIPDFKPEPIPSPRAPRLARIQQPKLANTYLAEEVETRW